MEIDVELEQAYAEDPNKTVRVIIGLTSEDADLAPIEGAGVNLVDVSAVNEGRVVGEMPLTALPALRNLAIIDYISLDSIATIQ